jgi:transposase
MRTKHLNAKKPAEQVVKDIRRAPRRHFSAEDKIRIVLEGLRGDYSIAELCRKEGIAQSLYYTWSKEFMEAGKRRLAGDTARAATTVRLLILKAIMSYAYDELKSASPHDKSCKPFDVGGPTTNSENWHSNPARSGLQHIGPI